MLNGYTIIEDVESDCLLHQYTAAHVQPLNAGIKSLRETLPDEIAFTEDFAS
jgi:hypothetical protein